VAKSASAKKMLMGDLMQTVGILPILILIVAVFGFIAPNFFTESNLLNITRQASINIVLAAGMTFIILTGGIDLSVGSILGTTAVAAMVVSLIPQLAFLSVPAALMLGLVLGLFNGILVAFAGLPPLSSRLAPIRRCAAQLTCWRTAPRSSTPVSGSSGSAITTSARFRGWWSLRWL
jgi:ribose transport system permease protein